MHTYKQKGHIYCLFVQYIKGSSGEILSLSALITGLMYHRVLATKVGENEVGTERNWVAGRVEKEGKEKILAKMF